MVAQMAQFSQLQSTAESNSYLQNISDALTGTRLSDAASWIGKSMLVQNNIATPDGSGAYGGELTLSQDAQDVAVDLVDGSGNTVKTIDLGAKKAARPTSTGTARTTTAIMSPAGLSRSMCAAARPRTSPPGPASSRSSRRPAGPTPSSSPHLAITSRPTRSVSADHAFRQFH